MMRDKTPSQYRRNIDDLFKTKEFRRFIEGAFWGGMDLHDKTTGWSSPGESQGFYSDIWGRHMMPTNNQGRMNKGFFEGHGIKNYRRTQGIVQYMDEFLEHWILQTEDAAPEFIDAVEYVKKMLRERNVEQAKISIILRELEHSRNKLMNKPFGLFDSFFDKIHGTGDKVQFSDTIPIDLGNKYVGPDDLVTKVAATYRVNQLGETLRAVDESHIFMQQLIIESIGQLYTDKGSLTKELSSKRAFVNYLESYILTEGFGDEEVAWKKVIREELKSLNKYKPGFGVLAYHQKGYNAIPEALTAPPGRFEKLTQVGKLTDSEDWAKFVARYENLSLYKYVSNLGPELTWEEAVKKVRAGKRLDVDELNRAAHVLVRYIRGELLTADDLAPLNNAIKANQLHPIVSPTNREVTGFLNEIILDSFKVNRADSSDLLRGLQSGVTDINVKDFTDWYAANLRPFGQDLGTTKARYSGDLKRYLDIDSASFVENIGKTFDDVFNEILKRLGVTKDNWDSVQKRLIDEGGFYMHAIKHTLGENRVKLIDDIMNRAARAAGTGGGRASDEAAGPGGEWARSSKVKEEELFRRVRNLDEQARFSQFLSHLTGRRAAVYTGEEDKLLKKLINDLDKRFKVWLNPAGAGFEGGPKGKRWRRVETDQQRARRKFDEAVKGAGRPKPGQSYVEWLEEMLSKPGNLFEKEIDELIKLHNKYNILGSTISEEAVEELKRRGFTIPEGVNAGRLERILKGIFTRPSFDEYLQGDALRRALASGEASWDDMPGIRGGDKFKKLKFYTTKAAWMPKWAATAGKKICY